MEPKVIFNHHLKNVKPSVVGKFLEIANEYKEIISLSVGEPDFQTPWHIRQAGIEAILPYPCNPTGAIMEKEDLEAIAEVIRETDMLVLSDEIYAELNYSDISHVSIASIEGMRQRTIVTSGFSKAFAMTGWRIGYACAPEEIISAMTKYHQYAIMCAPTVSQFAAIEALKNGASDILTMRNEYNMRRRYIVDRLLKMGLSCYEPKGAFYVFPNISSTGLGSEDFCERLLKQKQVAVIPGNAFGQCGEGFIRISYSFSLKHIIEATNRMEEFIQELSQG